MVRLTRGRWVRIVASLLIGLGLPGSVVSQTVKFAHCLAGCPVGAATDNDIIARPIYTLSFNRQTHIADWVAYVVTSGSIGVATNLARQPLRDPYVEDTLTPELLGDESGSIELSPFAPLVSFAGTPYWNDVNFLTNMAPRNSELNRGAWYGLEWAVRNLANRSDGLYVLAGPVYDSRTPRSDADGAKPVRFPVGFFKIVADHDGNIAAFLFDQELPFHVHHCERLVGLRDVEKATGLDFYPERRDWPAGDLSARLGCFR